MLKILCRDPISTPPSDAMAAPDPMRSISVDRWSVLGDIPRTSLTSAAFVIIGEVCSDDGELVPHVLLHTKERRTLMKGVSSYFGLGKSVPYTAYLNLGLYSLRRRRLTGIGISMINLRWSDDRLRFVMGIPILIRRRLLSE